MLIRLFEYKGLLIKFNFNLYDWLKRTEKSEKANWIKKGGVKKEYKYFEDLVSKQLIKKLKEEDNS